MTINPDRWIIVNMTLDGNTTQHVFSGGYGGYCGSDTWRLSTKIESIVKKDKIFEIETISGTQYSCNIMAYGMSSYMSNVYDNLVENNPGALSVDASYKEVFDIEMRKPRVL